MIDGSPSAPGIQRHPNVYVHSGHRRANPVGRQRRSPSPGRDPSARRPAPNTGRERRTCDQGTDRRHRRRGGRPHRRLPAATPLRRAAVRGRAAARRARPHPRAWPPAHGTVAGGQRLHRAQRAHLPEPAAPVRRAGRAHPGLRHVDERALPRLRPGVRGRARRLAGLFPRPGNLDPPALPADARRDPQVPPARPPGAGHRAGPRRRRTGPSASSSRTAGTPRYFVEHFLLPVVSAVWSAPERVSRDVPGALPVRFLAHHGMLSVAGSPTWKTVVGGSRSYVERAAEEPHRRAGRHPGPRGAPAGRRGRAVRDDADAAHHVDRVVLATHADQALAPARRRDTARRRRCSARSPTPATRPGCTPTPPCCREQPAARPRRGTTSNPPARGARPGAGQLPHEPADAARHGRPVTWSPSSAADRVDTGAVLARMVYEHPVYTPSLGGRTAPSARDRRPAHRVRRRLPRLGFPRGRLRSRACARREQFGAGW